MATKKTIEELRSEAKALITKAKQQEQELLKQARELELESFQSLGRDALRFLKNEITLEELNAKATALKIK